MLLEIDHIRCIGRIHNFGNTSIDIMGSVSFKNLNIQYDFPIRINGQTIFKILLTSYQGTSFT